MAAARPERTPLATSTTTAGSIGRMAAELEDPPVIVEIRRRVRPEAREAFERDLKALIAESLAVAGNEACTVLRPEPGSPELEYRVVVKFPRASAWRAWQESERLGTWWTAIRPHLVADPVVTVTTGLEAWFTLPGERTVRPPPRHKQVLVTWLGVFLCAAGLQTVLLRVWGEWNLYARTLLQSLLVVLLLTYLVMPLLNRLLRPWLRP
jgi:uncharacterized protein